MTLRALTDGLRWLSRWWLTEITADDLARIQAVADEGDPVRPSADLEELAVEYQRLIGFDVPPYESVYLDPSGMMGAPATGRLERTLRAAGWSPPARVRTGSPDHLGVELLAWADLLDAGHSRPAATIHRDHLALWVPVWVESVLSAAPHPVYAALTHWTLRSVLDPIEAHVSWGDPMLPDLPAPPRYRGTGIAVDGTDLFHDDLGLSVPGGPPSGSVPPVSRDTRTSDVPPTTSRRPPRSNRGVDDLSEHDRTSRTDAHGSELHAETGEAPEPDGSRDRRSPPDREASLRDIVRRLLVPRTCGFWISRTDVGRLCGELDVPLAIGSRSAMLEAYLKGAATSERADEAFAALWDRCRHARDAHRAWGQRWPAWSPVGATWEHAVRDTMERVDAWRTAARTSASSGSAR